MILRGNRRDSIFFRAADRDRFAALVAENIERFRIRVHAYCWMSNHVHLLVQVADIPLARDVMRIAGRYAREMQRHRVLLRATPPGDTGERRQLYHFDANTD